jgi:type II secretory pathway component PulK
MVRRRERGYALLSAVLVIFLLSIALALLGASLQLRMRLVRDEGRTVILGALSDAAVAEALANLAQSGSYSGSPEHELGGGRIGSQVAFLGAGIYDVVATASFGGRRRVVQAEVVRGPGTARVRFWRRLPGEQGRAGTRPRP